MIQSIQRAVEMLRLFQNNKTLRITDISNMLDLHKSTTFGIANTLEQLGLLAQNQDTGMYKLGLELYRLGTHVDMSLSEICAPYLEQLLSETEETVNLVAPFGNQIIFLDKFESTHSMRIFTYVGQTLPMYCTATGKVMMAFMDPERVQNILETTEFKKNTENTMLSRDEIMRSLPQIRFARCAMDREELEQGLVSIAVPIVDRQKHAVGAISVSGPATRMDMESCENIKQRLFACLEQIEEALGYK